MPGIVYKDVKINKFISDVMTYNRGLVARYRGVHPLMGRPSHSANVSELDTRTEATPNNFRVVATSGGLMTASALATIFQVFAYNITRYRPVRMYVTSSGGPAITNFGTAPTALNGRHRMNVTTFRNLVNASPGIANLAPGNVNAESALDNLILTLRNIVYNNMYGATYMTMTACHNSCHSSCHGSRSRR